LIYGQPAGSEPNLSDTLREIGQDAAEVIARAQSEAIGAAYLAATEEARQRGIFGAPRFCVGGELFWGDDRLEDAIAWHRDGRLRRGGPWHAVRLCRGSQTMRRKDRTMPL
jgi:2-hydroxychromene-2-carboxylate isomerase